jgi:hypothetical protein
MHQYMIDDAWSCIQQHGYNIEDEKCEKYDDQPKIFVGDHQSWAMMADARATWCDIENIYSSQITVSRIF